MGMESLEIRENVFSSKYDDFLYEKFLGFPVISGHPGCGTQNEIS